MSDTIKTRYLLGSDVLAAKVKAANKKRLTVSAIGAVVGGAITALITRSPVGFLLGATVGVAGCNVALPGPGTDGGADGGPDLKDGGGGGDSSTSPDLKDGGVDLPPGCSLVKTPAFDSVLYCVGQPAITIPADCKLLREGNTLVMQCPNKPPVTVFPYNSASDGGV